MVPHLAHLADEQRAHRLRGATRGSSETIPLGDPVRKWCPLIFEKEWMFAFYSLHVLGHFTFSTSSFCPVSKTRKTKLMEEGHIRNLCASIENTWKQIKRVRAETGYTNTEVKMKFHKWATSWMRINLVFLLLFSSPLDLITLFLFIKGRTLMLKQKRLPNGKNWRRKWWKSAFWGRKCTMLNVGRMKSNLLCSSPKRSGKWVLSLLLFFFIRSANCVV